MDPDNSFVDNDSNDARQLAVIAEEEGFESVDELVHDQALKSVQYGCCGSCDAVMLRMEPDQHKGWCSECDGYGVKSVAVLAGLC
jgi:hypothetical protein